MRWSNSLKTRNEVSLSDGPINRQAAKTQSRQGPVAVNRIQFAQRGGLFILLGALAFAS